MLKIIRIISGEKRGFILKTKEGLETRPTLDYVRENVFNIIQNQVRGSKVLDLFAGSGAIGIEALSRGAVKAVFVEVDYKALKVITSNLEKTGYNKKGASVVFHLSFDKFLAKNQEAFDWIYIDPPYGLNKYEEILNQVALNHSLREEGMIIIEGNKKQKIAENEYFHCYREIIYGNTKLWFYKKV